jgi:hypothetical protein
MISFILRTRVGRWVAGLVVGYILFRLAVLDAERRGRGQESAKRAEDNVKASQKAKELRHAIETSDDQRLVDILTGRVRD